MNKHKVLSFKSKMNRFLRFLMILIMLSMMSHAFAQQSNSITRDPEGFKAQVIQLLEEADKKETKQFIEEQWTPSIQASSFTDEQWTTIYDLSEYMLKKRVSTLPYILQFTEILVLKTQFASIQDQFDQILETLVYAKDLNKAKEFKAFLTSLYSTLTSGIFYQTNTVLWKTNSNSVTIELEEEPVFSFENAELICVAKNDSSVIYGTSGKYYPLQNKWFGERGKIDWKRAGQDPTEVYADFDEYSMSLKSVSYRIDSVRFHHYLFSKPLSGNLNENILANVTPEKAKYPSFFTFDSRFEIKNIADQVDYSGGFSMSGATFNGFGTDDQPAKLFFKYKNKVRVEAHASFISMTPSAFGSDDAKIIIHIDSDTIYHPGLSLKFVKESRLLTMYRDDDGISKAPFKDDYHKFDIYSESFYWNIDDPIMDFGAIFGSTNRMVYFESQDYFSEKRFNDLIGMNRMHPLSAISGLTNDLGYDGFTLDEFAQYLKLSTVQTETLLFNLSIQGFVDYDSKSKYAVKNPKLDKYILDKAGKSDYDVIQIASTVSRDMNGSLNLDNNEIKLSGVRFFTLSDSNNVVIFPENGEITIEKDRDIKFGGVVYAGKFEYFGSDYYFDYEEFTINLIKVDSTRIKVPSFQPASDGSRPLRFVTNVIEGIRGSINVDDPMNKSGLKSEDYPEYPIFNCVKESYVYYDNSRIQDGVYDRERFYYEIEPFVIDSLEKFRTENISFSGKFVSGGIFDDMNEPLVIMPDYSLGFSRALPEEGITVYGGAAKFDNEITLSGKGLQGDGDLDFLSSHSHSMAFTFFPDSLQGLTDSFVNVESDLGGQVPETHADEVDLSFYPFENMLRASVYAQPIPMYNDQASLRSGYMELTEEGMGGNGTVEFSGAYLKSKDFDYDKDVIKADTSNFSLAAVSDAGMAFKTNNVSANVDFIERVGKFVSNDEESFVEFPSNQYICFMDKFNWYMDKNDIELESERGAKVVENDFVIDTDIEKSSSNFFSIHPDQDSLNFLAPKATFNLKTSIINCTDIMFIKTADARVYPDSGLAVIRKRAILDPFENSAVIANDITKYHSVYNADINIKGRFDYEGSGYVDYINNAGQVYQIWLKTIDVDTTYQTVADGVILGEEQFMLSANFEFQGDVDLEANRQFLVFDGTSRILHDCPEEQKYWIPFTAEVNPNDIQIPISAGIASTSNDKLFSGLVSRADPFGIYPVFLSRKDEDADQAFVNPTGYLSYDTKSNEYIIASEEKLKQSKLPGALAALNVNSCYVRTDGPINLGLEYNPIDIQLYGSTEYNAEDEDITMQVSMIMDFLFNDEALKIMLNDINRSPETKGVNLSKSYYEQSLKEVLGQEKADQLITDLNLTGAIRKLPDELKKTFYFAGIDMYWDPGAEAYKSKGLISIANIGDKQVFKAVKGNVMITRRRSGDRIEFYLELDERNWFFFSYSRGVMQAYAFNKDFNNILMEVKDDKRVIKPTKDQGPYEYILASKRKKDEFLERFDE
jgi:hypothetical protein